MIEIIHLSKSFGKSVLHDVNLTIESGETMVIIGRSGCGKSVLLKHITGLLRPDGGTLLVDGRDVTRLHDATWTGSGNGSVPLPGRCAVRFHDRGLRTWVSASRSTPTGRRSRSDERVRTCLQMVGLSGVEEQKPAELSGGMRKRVGLARAIAMDPEYILYDEPTTGLIR